MKEDTLTVSTEDAIRICENAIKTIEPYLEVEEGLINELRSKISKHVSAEDSAVIELKRMGLLNSWKYCGLHHLLSVPEVTICGFKHSLLNIVETCKLSPGEFSFSRESTLVLKCCTKSFCEKHLEDLSEYGERFEPKYQDMLEYAKSREKYKTEYPSSPETVLYDGPELGLVESFLIFGAVVLLAVLGISFMV